MSVALPRPSTLPPTYPRKEGSRGVSPHAQTPPRSGVSDGQRKSTSPSSHDKPMLSLRSNASDGVAASHSSASHSAPLSVHLVREGGRHATAAPAGGHPFLFPRASSLMHSTDEDDDNESVQQPLEVQLVRDGANRVAAPAAHRKPSALSTVYMDDHTTEVPSADEDEEAALSTVLLPSTVNRRAKHRVDSLPETDSEVSMESPHRPPGLTEGTDSAHDAGNQSHSSLNTSELQSDAPPQDQNHTATDRKTQPSPEQSHTSAPRTGDRGHHAQAHSLPEHLEGQEPATPASSRHTDMVESSHRSLLPTEEASDSATAESTKHAPEQSHTSAPRNAMSEGQPASTATLADRVEGLEPVSPASSRHTDLAESSQRSLPTNEAAQLSRNTPPTDRLPIDSDTSPQCLSQCAGNLSPQSSNIPTPQHQPDRKLGEEAGTPHESRHTSAEEASLPSSRSSVKGDPASVHNLSSRNMLDGVASQPSSRHAGMDGQSELSDSSSVGGHASVRDAPERDAGSEVGSNYPSRHAEAHEPSQVAHPSAASVQSAQSAATTQSHMLSQCAGNFSAPSTQATSPQATSPQAQDKCVTPVVSCLSEHNEGDEARTMSGSRHTMSEEASIPSSRSSVKGGPASVHNLSSRNMLDGVASEPSSRHAGMDGQSELSDSSSLGGHASVRDAPERDAGSEVGSNYPSRHAEAHEPSQVAHPSAASVQSAQSAATTQSYMLSQCAGNFSVPSTQATTPQAQDKCVTPVVSCLSEHNEGDEARTMSGSRNTMSEEASIPSSRSSVKGGPASVHNLSSRNMLDGVASEPSSRHAGMDGQSELSDSSSVGGHASVRDAPERDAGSEVGSNYPSRHAEAHEPSQLSHRSAASVQSAATTQSYMLSQCAGNFSVTSTQNTTPRAQNKCATPIVSRLSEHNEGDEARTPSGSRHTMAEEASIPSSRSSVTASTHKKGDESSLPSSRSSVKAAPASVRNLSSRSMLYGAPSELSSRRAGMDDESEAAETPSVAGYASVRDAPERDAGSEVGSNYPSRHAEAHEPSQLSHRSAASVQSAATTQSYMLSQCAGNFSVTSTQNTTPRAQNKCATPIVSRLSEHNEGDEARTPSGSRHTMVDEASVPSSRSSVTASTHKKGDESSLPSSRSSVKAAPASVRNLSSRSMLYGAPSELSSRRAGMDDESEAAETPSVAGYASVRDAPERDAGSEVGSNYPSRHAEAHEPSQLSHRSAASVQSAATTQSYMLSQCAGNFSVTSTQNTTPRAQNKCATPIVSRLSEHNEGAEVRSLSESRHTMVDEASLPSSRSSVKAAPASVRNLSSRSMLYGAPSELSSRRAGMDDESETAETPSVAGYASVRDAPERDAGSEVGSNYPSRHAEAHEPSQLSQHSAPSVQSATTQSYLLSQCAGNFSVTSTQATTPQAKDKCATPIVSRLSEHNEGAEVRSLSESRHTMVDEASIPSSRSSVKAAPASVRNLSSRSMLYGAPSELSSRRAGMDDESETAETPSVAGYASVRDAPERDAGSEVGSNYPSHHVEAEEASLATGRSSVSEQSALPHSETVTSGVLSQCAGNFSVTTTEKAAPVMQAVDERQMEGVESARSSVRGGFDSQVSVPTGGPAEACVCDSRRMGDEANSSTTSSRRGCLDAASEMPDVEVSAQSSQILSQCAGEMEAMTLSNTDVEETKRRPRGTTEFTAVPDEDVSEVRESDAGLPELPLDRFAYDAYYMELRALREAIPNDDACGTSPLMVMKRHAACLDAQLQQRVRQLLEQEADALSECDSQCHFISSKYPCLASLVSPANLRVFQSPSVIAALAKYDAAHSTGGNEAAAGVELHATVEDVLQKRQLEEEGIVREYPFLCCGTEAQLVDLHLESVPEMEAMKKQHRDLAKDGDCPELRRLEKAMHDSARCLAEDDARRVRHQLLEAHYLREQLKPLEEDPTVEVSYVKAGVLYNPTCHALAKTVQHLRSQAATPAELEDAVAQLRAEADRIVESKREVSAKLVERFQSLPLVLLGVPLADLPLSSDAAFQALSGASTADPSALLACATQVASLQRSVMDLRRDADDDVLARLPFLSRNYAGAGVPLRELRLMQDATLGCLGEERLRLLASTEHGTPIADTSDLDAKMMNRIEELAEACTAEEEVVVQRFGLHEAFPAGSGNKRAAALLLPQDVEVKRLTERQGEDLAAALHHRALEIFEEDACDERLAAQERNGLRRDYPMCAQDMTEAVLRDATFTSLCATRARLLMDPAAHDAKLSDIERSMTERGLEIEALRRRPLHREVMVRLVDLNHVALCTNYQHMQSEDYYVRRYRHLNQRMLNRPLLPYTEPNMVETLLLPTRTRQVASLEPTDPFLAELRVSAQSLLSSGSGPADALVCSVYRQMDARVAQLQRDRIRVQEVVEAREAAIQGRFPTLPAIMCGLPLAELCHDSTLVEAAQQLDALRQDADAPQATIAEAQQHLVACATQVAANLAREEAQLRQQMPCVGTLAGRPALRGLHLTSVPEMDALLRQHRELAKSGESPELRRLEKVIQDLAQRIAENVAERMRHELLEAHFLKQQLATVNEDPMAGMNYAEAGVLHDAKCRELAKEVEQLRSQAAEDAVVEEAMKRLVERADRVLAFKRQRTAQLAQSYPPLSSTVLGVLLADLPLSTDAEFQAAVAQCAKCARSDDADERARLPEGQGKLLSRVDELARQVNLVRLFHAVEDDAVRARHPFLPSNNVCWVPCRDLALEEDPSTLNFMHQRRRAIQVGDATREAEVDAQLMTRATAIATDLIIASDATHRRALYASEWKHAAILFPSLVVDRDDVFASLQETGTNDAQRLDEVAEAQNAVMEKTRARVAELLSAYTAVEQSIAQETCGLRNRYAMCVRDVNPAVEDDQYFAVLKQTHDDWQNVVDAHHAAIHEVEDEMWRQSVSLIPDDRRVATAFGAECQAEAQLRLASDPNAALLRQRDSAFYSHQLWRLRQLRRRPNYAADASELSTSACDEQLDVSSLAAQDSYYLLLQHHRDMCAASDEKGAPVRCIDVLLRRRMRQLGDAARRQKRAITQQDDHLRRQFPCLRLNSSATPLASLSYGEDAELQRLVAEHTRLLRPPNDIKERYPFLPDSIDDVPIEDLELEKDPLFLRLAAQRQDLLGPLRKKIDAVKQVEAEIQTRFSVLLAEDVREESELRATYPFADPQVAVPLRCLHLSRRKDFVARLETYKAMASSDDEEVRRQRDELEAELRDAVNQLAAAEALWQRSRWLTAESLVHAFPCLPVQPTFGIHLGEIGLLEDATFRRLCVQLLEARKSTADDRDADIASREVQLIQHVQAVAAEKQASSVTGQKRFPGLPQRVDGLFLCDLVSALEQRGTVDDEAAVWNEAARQKLTQTYRAEEDEAVWCRHPFFRDMQLSGMPLRDMTELSERDKFHTYFKRWLTAISRRSKEKKERAPMFEDLLRETAMVVVADRILSDASFHDDLRQAGVTCMALDPAVPLHQLRSYSSETTKPLVIHNDTVGATEEEQNLLSRICSSYGAALTSFSTRLEDVRRQYPGVHHREINVVSATDNEMLVLHAQRVAAGAARTVATHEAREEAEEGLKDRSVALMEEDHYVVEAAELCDALRDVPMVKLPTEADMMHRWGFVVARAHHHRRQMYDFAALPAEAEEDRTGSSKSTRSRRRTPAPVEMTEVPDNEVVEINDDLISTTSSEETHRRRVAKAEKPAPVPAAPREVLPDRDAVAEAEAMPVAAAEEVVPAPVAAAAPIKATEAAEARFVVPSACPRPEQPMAQRSASKKKRPTRCPRPHVNISKLEEDPVGELRTGRWEEFLPLTRGAAQKLRQMLGGKDEKGGLGSGKRRQSMPAERIPRGSRWFSAVIPQDEPEVVEIRTERQYIARTLHKANKHLPRRVTEEEVESSPNAMDLVFEYYDLSSRAGAAGSIRHAAPIVRARLAELNQLFEEWIASAAKSSDTPDLADKGEEDRLIAEAKAVRLARRDGLRASASHSCVCNPRNVPMRWAHLSTEELEHDDDLRHLVDSGASKEEIRGHLVNWSLLKETANDALFTKYSFLPVLPYGYSLAELNLMEDGTFQGYARNGAYKSSPHLQASMREAVESLAKNKAAAAPRGTGFVERVRAAMMDGQPDEPLSSRDGSSARSSPREDDPMVAALRAAREKKLSAFLNDATRSSFLLESQTKSRSVLQHLMQHIADISPDLPSVECTREMPLSVDDITALRTFFDGLDPDNFGLVDRADFEHFAVLTLSEEVPHLTRQVVDRLTFSTDFDATNIAVKAPELVDFSDFTTFYKSLALVELRRQMETQEQRRRESTRLGALGLTGPTASGGQRASGLAGSRPAPAVAQVH